MLGGLANLELFDHRSAERVFGQHALYRFDDRLIGILEQKLGILLLLETAHIAGVICAQLLIGYEDGEHDLVGIDHYNVIDDVGIGRVLGLSLALEHHCHLARKPAERNVRGIDHIPIALVFLIPDLVIGGTGIDFFSH